MEWTWASEWWFSVVIISLINISIGIYIFVKTHKSNTGSKMNYRYIVAVNGILFLSVALYRSIFVSRYLTQLAWFDTLLNSSLLIRSLACTAEISFALLIMNGLLQFNKEIPIPDSHKENKFLNFLETKAPMLLPILIIIAQPLAYGGLIFKFRILFAIEETLWGIGFLLITPLILMQFKRVYSIKENKEQYILYKMMVTILAAFSVGYVVYSLFYHLPIEYWPAAINQVTTANPDVAITFSFQAFVDSLLIVNPTRDYEAWGGIGFVIWHTGYFTICGWIVLILMAAPRKLKKKSNQK